MAIGTEFVVRDACVQRRSFARQSLERRARVAILQQRAALVVTRALQQFVDRGVEEHDDAALGEVAPIVFAQYHSAAGCEHDAFALRQFVDRLMFAFAKAGFAFDVEDPCDFGTRALFDDAIGIKERQLQLFRQQTPDRRLADSHQTDQENVVILGIHNDERRREGAVQSNTGTFPSRPRLRYHRVVSDS
ncbi:MAG TPA: hypothetical protein VFG38_17060 [Pseudomonadales bacterium]|nr:hypothetical protein [Pseudomonadales bacterium]